MVGVPVSTPFLSTANIKAFVVVSLPPFLPGSGAKILSICSKTGDSIYWECVAYCDNQGRNFTLFYLFCQP